MLVPDLAVLDPDVAAAGLAGFGFVPDGGLWRLGNQVLRLSPASPGGAVPGHGRIDHIALTVPDIDAALAGLVARGIALDTGVTPDGPGLIPEFWGDGLRYVYLAGPEGARIEFCQRITGAPDAMGHDHIGIPCDDIAAMTAFFQAQGASPVAAYTLSRPGGDIPVRFLAFQGGVIELYQPAAASRSAPSLWSRLLVGGLAAAVDGPEGLHLAPL